MEVIYGLIPGMVILGLIMVGVFFWAARSGQFDDMEGDASRILMDEDDEPAPPAEKVDTGDGEKNRN
ncbi:MAG: cbb3-type cytochrome oxidase assembly protein CcoS [Gammaproteobacteria bacterium]|nr:cbb3-type cytochrome oxidase assembly protein CcoS [Gammaproteobacteria bacterium]